MERDKLRGVEGLSYREERRRWGREKNGGKKEGPKEDLMRGREVERSRRTEREGGERGS